MTNQSKIYQTGSNRIEIPEVKSKQLFNNFHPQPQPIFDLITKLLTSKKYRILIVQERHFDCERDFYVFRNHANKTLFEPSNFSQKARRHANKTFSYEQDISR